MTIDEFNDSHEGDDFILGTADEQDRTSVVVELLGDVKIEVASDGGPDEGMEEGRELGRGQRKDVVEGGIDDLGMGHQREGKSCPHKRW